MTEAVVWQGLGTDASRRGSPGLQEGPSTASLQPGIPGRGQETVIALPVTKTLLFPQHLMTLFFTFSGSLCDPADQCPTRRPG